jgi:hypothetical protein
MGKAALFFDIIDKPLSLETIVRVFQEIDSAFHLASLTLSFTKPAIQLSSGSSKLPWQCWHAPAKRCRGLSRR